MTLRALLLLALLGPALAAPPSARAAQPRRKTVSRDEVDLKHRRARAQMRTLEFEAAVPILEELVAREELSPSRRAVILVDLGIAYVNLGETDKARRSFSSALSFDSKVTLPPRSAPKIQALFASAKEDAEAPAPPPTPEAPPEPSAPSTATASSPPTEAPPVEVRPTGVEALQTPPRTKSLTLPLSLAGVGAAGLAVGIWGGLSSRSIASDLESDPRPGNEVDELLSKRKSRSTASFVGYSVAAAGAVSAVLVYLLQGEETPRVSASGHLMSDGAGASAVVRF